MTSFVLLLLERDRGPRRKRRNTTALNFFLTRGMRKEHDAEETEGVGARELPQGEEINDLTGAKSRRAFYSSFVRTNATRKPTTVMSPAKSCASSNASGIIVSASMARIAPAATAVVAAITSAEKRLKSA